MALMDGLQLLPPIMEEYTPNRPMDERPRDQIKRNYFFGAIGAILIIISFITGVFIGGLNNENVNAAQVKRDVLRVLVNRNAPPPPEVQDLDFAKFWDVWQTVKDRYVKEPPSDSKMFYGAIEGMVASLNDPYSVFFDPDLAKKFSQDLEGTFDGIGAEIGIRNDQVTIIAPLPGTPADRAGLKAGDRILEIDGTDTTGMMLEDAVSRIRGPRGTSVDLLVGREGLKEPKKFAVVRDTITVDPVKWKIVTKGGKHIAVITLSHFNDVTAPKFADAVRAALLENPAGFVIDLRNNPGGYLESSVNLAGAWIPRETVVTERFSDGKEQKYIAPDGGKLADMRTIVLINEGSASASEILAGALKDTGKATIVGEKSYGKGSVQDYMTYEDDSALKLTVALWYTPKGNSIDKQGITPDVEVKMTPEDINADKDPQMDAAVDMIVSPEKLPAGATVEATTDSTNSPTNERQ